MIFEFLANSISSVVAWFISLIPSYNIGSQPWYQQGRNFWNIVVENGPLFSTWIPIKDIYFVAQSFLTVFAITLGITALRLVLSLFTGGGGNTR